MVFGRKLILLGQSEDFKMNLSKCFLVLAIALFSVFYGKESVGETAFERMPKKMSKTYDNGDSLEISCDGFRNEKCLLIAEIGGVKRKFRLDFASRGYVPNLDFIRMIGAGSRPWAFGAAVSVECNRRDEKVLPEEIPGSICYVYLSFNGAGEVVWQEFMVVGQLSPEVFEGP